MCQPVAPHGRDAPRAHAGSRPAPAGARGEGIRVTETGSAGVAETGASGTGAAGLGDRVAQGCQARGGVAVGTAGYRDRRVRARCGWAGSQAMEDTGLLWWVGHGGSFPVQRRRQERLLGAAVGRPPPRPQSPILGAQPHGLCGRGALGWGGGVRPQPGLCVAQGHGAQGQQPRWAPQTRPGDAGWALEEVAGHDAGGPASSRRLPRGGGQSRRPRRIRARWCSAPWQRDGLCRGPGLSCVPPASRVATGAMLEAQSRCVPGGCCGSASAGRPRSHPHGAAPSARIPPTRPPAAPGWGGSPLLAPRAPRLLPPAGTGGSRSLHRLMNPTR